MVNFPRTTTKLSVQKNCPLAFVTTKDPCLLFVILSVILKNPLFSSYLQELFLIFLEIYFVYSLLTSLGGAEGQRLSGHMMPGHLSVPHIESVKMRAGSGTVVLPPLAFAFLTLHTGQSA